MKEFNFINAAKLHDDLDGEDDHDEDVDDQTRLWSGTGEYRSRGRNGGVHHRGRVAASRSQMSSLSSSSSSTSSEMQFNLLEKDNKSQVDGKIVAKRATANAMNAGESFVRTGHDDDATAVATSRNNSNPQTAFNVNINRGANKSLNPHAATSTTSLTDATVSTTNRAPTPNAITTNQSNNNDDGLIPDGVAAIAAVALSQLAVHEYQLEERQRRHQHQAAIPAVTVDNTKMQNDNQLRPKRRPSQSSLVAGQQPLHRVPNDDANHPIKYSHMRAAASTSLDLDATTGGGGSYETRQSASTMELECIAGYDGGLPQQFVLEAYDSRTKKLRLNVTSTFTDVPLFRFDLSGKLESFS